MDRGTLNLPPVNGSDSPALEGGATDKELINQSVVISQQAIASILTPTKEDEIAKLEGEMALLGKSSIANQRRSFLQKQIDKLKYS